MATPTPSTSGVTRQENSRTTTARVTSFHWDSFIWNSVFHCEIRRKGTYLKEREKGDFQDQESRVVRFPDLTCQDLLRNMHVNDPAQRLTANDILKHPVLKQNANATHGNQRTIHYFHNIKAKHVVIGTGVVMYVNSGHRIQVKKIKISPTKPLTKSQEQPSTDQLLDIKKKVGQDWKDLGRRLNFDDSVLEQMHEENKTLEEHIYQILRRWKQRENVNATRERLAQVFMKLDRGDLADILADD